MPTTRPCPGLSEPLGDPYVAAIEDALTLATFSPARLRRHDALLAQHFVPRSWAAWSTQPALYALLDRIARSRSARPGAGATYLWAWRAAL